MDLALIENLLKLMDQSTAEELNVTENGVTIRISKRAASAPAPVQRAAVQAPVRDRAQPAARSGLVDIRAGMTGVFYRSPSPAEKPFVEIGDGVRDGQTLGLLEAMKTFNPVEAECDGVVAEICGTDGQLIEAGDLLYRLERA